MDNKLITVYTPTYNRAYRIGDLYDSLVRQTDQRFDWLIIDDGSTDDTESIVQEWINEDKIAISYIKQENKGKQEAVNKAHSLLQSPLNTCVDSDDYLTDDAIEIILTAWDTIKEDNTIAGIVGLDIFRNGDVVGTKFPENIKILKFSQFLKNGIYGDKKFVYKTSVIHEMPEYPAINNERFPAPGYLYRLIDEKYSLFLMNKNLCVVEYLSDGISKNKIIQLRKNPNAFRFYRYERMRLAIDFKDRVKNTIHFISCCFLSQTPIFQGNTFKVLTFVLLPFGFLLYLYIVNTSKKGVV